MNNEDKVNINIEETVNSEIESNHTLSFKNTLSTRQFILIEMILFGMNK